MDCMARIFLLNRFICSVTSMSKYFVTTIAQQKSTSLPIRTVLKWAFPQIVDKRLTYDELIGRRAEQP